MAQTSTHAVRIQKIMIRHGFQKGYYEAAAGQPFSKDYDKMNPLDQWGYERGRHFFFAAGHMTLKRGRGICSKAVNKWVELKQANAII